MSKYFLVLLAALALLSGSCAKKGGAMFDKLIASDFGIGIHLEDSADTVHAALGQPTTTKDVQADVNVEEFYFSQSMPKMGVNTPQLSLNFQEGKLIRVHNAYDATNPDLPKPPFIIEPVPGIKLGIRRSGFIDILGKPTDSVITDTWVFKGSQGRQIVLRAEFSKSETAGDALCKRLQVVLVNAIPPQRGEAYEPKGETK